MSKKALIEHLQQNIYCRVQVSSIHGVGVFAIKPIPKNTDPFNGCPDLKHYQINPDELTELHPNVYKYVKDLCVFRDGKYLIPNLSLIDISYFINHSKQPNIGTNTGGEFFTLRNIEEGEELTVDYGTYSEDFVVITPR